jgi:hypothetical protein
MRLSIMGVLLCATLVACVNVMPQKDFNLEKVREKERLRELIKQMRKATTTKREQAKS